MMYKVRQRGGGTVVSGLSRFEPIQTFTCGQCFRWAPRSDGSFTGVAGGRVINVKRSGDEIILNNCTLHDFDTFWRNYFDLDRDYGKIINSLSADSILKSAISCASGIRILRQEFFETLLSFIISANNNIVRISKIVQTFCECFGEKLYYNGETHYAFPEAEALRGITEKDLQPLRSGYRAKYLVSAVNSYLSGEICPGELLDIPIEDAKKRLCKISGVGPKVADCILLFALSRFDAFPTDVWIKRVMNELYSCGEDKAFETGRRLYGENAGLAQQYLFFWRRQAGF